MKGILAGLAALLLLVTAATGAHAVCVAGGRVPDTDTGACSGTPNIDTDGDDYGDPCDSDYNQDCVVGIEDFLFFRECYGPPGTQDPVCDHTADGTVGLPDFNIFYINFQLVYPDAGN
jgi:hypothetical protein